VKDRTIIVRRLADGALAELMPDGPVLPLPDTTDWAELGRMSDEEIEAAARSDPDNLPLTEADLERMPRRPRTITLRRTLGLTQEAFAARYRIPLGTLRDWEQGRSTPDQPARAYLAVIAADPELVSRLLEAAKA